MKIRFLIPFFTLSLFSIACSESPAEKVEDATENVMEAREELVEARRDSMVYMKFKTDSDMRLDEIEKGIADLMSRNRSKAKEKEEQFDRDLKDIEVESTELREDLKTYTTSDLDNWESYKFSFNERLNELKTRLSELEGKVKG